MLANTNSDQNGKGRQYDLRTQRALGWQCAARVITLERTSALRTLWTFGLLFGHCDCTNELLKQPHVFRLNLQPFTAVIFKRAMRSDELLSEGVSRFLGMELQMR